MDLLDFYEIGMRTANQLKNKGLDLISQAERMETQLLKDLGIRLITKVGLDNGVWTHKDLADHYSHPRFVVEALIAKDKSNGNRLERA
jgi:hypothetical protein